MPDLYTRTWIFSSQQQEELLKIKGKSYVLGSVIVNGVPKPYTDILRDPSICRFTDAKQLITGDIRRISYTKPSNNNGSRY